MGFLSGVLGAVKDDDAVKTYDQHLAMRLENVLNTLNNKIGSGRTGLADAVAEVREWLEGYDGELSEKTNNVIKNINELIIEKINDKTTDINNAQSSGCEAIHKTFNDIVKQITHHMSTIKNNNDGYNGLDEALKNKMDGAIGKMDGAIEVLKKSAGNDVIAMQAKMLDEALVEKEQAILTAIEKQYKALKITSEDELWKVRENILTLENARNDVFKHLDNALKIASRELLGYNGRDFDNKYKNKILARFEDIKDSVKSLHKNISTNRLVLHHLVNQARDNFTGIKEQAGKLGDGSEETINGNWGQLMKNIKQRVKELYDVDENRTKNGHLGEMVTNVGAYAGTFSDATKFGKKVEKWIDDILNGNEVVMGWIQNYLDKNYNDNPSQGEKYTKLTKIIAAAITNAIKRDVIEVAVEAFKDTKQEQSEADYISANISAVKSVIETFVAPLGQKMKLTGGVFEKFADPLVKEIERRLISEGALSKNPSAYKSHLPDALLAILTALQSKAEHVSDELTSFTGIDAQMLSDDDNHEYNLGKHVSEAINKVELIGKEFDNSKQSRGEKIGSALATVDDKITELDKLLTKSSGEIDSTIEYIKGDIESLHNLKKEKDELNKEDGEINKQKDTAAAKLDELKEAMQKKLKAISQAAYQANDAVTHTINLLKQALDKAYEHITQAILELQTKLTQNTRDGFNDVTKQVRLSFATSKIAGLDALKKLALEQKNVIDKIIQSDMKTGLKELMNRLKGNAQSTLEEIKENLPPENQHTVQHMSSLFDKLQIYLDNILMFITYQLIGANKPNDQSKQVDDIKSAVDDMLVYLKTEVKAPRTYTFDYTFKTKLTNLHASLSHLTHTQNNNPRHPELLDALRAGLTDFSWELGKAYVNKYDGHEDILLYNAKSQKVTDEGKACAKVLFTVFEILEHDLSELTKRCKEGGGWAYYKINLKTVNRNGVAYKSGVKPEQVVNGLGAFLQQCDYRLTDDPQKQNGDLDKNKTGQKIFDDLLNVPINGANSNGHLKRCYEGDEKEELTKKTTKNAFNLSDVLECLMKHLHQYYRACHLGTTSAKTQPSSVHKMLVWLAGFPYSPRYQDFHLNGFDDLFEKPKDKTKESDTGVITLEITDGSDGISLPVQVGDENCLDAYPKPVKASEMADDLSAVCTHAHSVLTAILGHGHENSVYACDYNTNHYGLHYPSDNGACLDMLADILNRLFHQLRFVYGQCINGPGSSGWADCWYGKEIGGSAWSCNTKQCPNQIGDQPCKQMANQKADQGAEQKCDRHPTCGLKSPLQSFLEDGLQGFLPHQFTKPGCKLECTVTKHRGIPCKTPMGFADISSMASHTQQGSHLKDILKELCGDSNKPLSQLCGMLNCLMRRTPQTLGDMFAFYHQFLYNWDKAGQVHKKNAFEAAVSDANFGDMDTTLDVIHLQNTKKHDSHAPGKLPKLKGDMFSLTSCDNGTNPGLPCGPYLQSISDDITMVFSKKHAGDYVSWFVYITETFYDLLKKLYDDCCNKCNKKGRRCYDKGCNKDCQVRFKYEYKKPVDREIPDALSNIKHRTTCNSIVQCRSTHALIYASGFTFGSPHALSGQKDKMYKRTCEDFCTALGRVISDVEAHDAPLAKLIYVTIPNFLFTIRAPFLWMNVALWLLSFLYLIHIMVIRLDLLHIKSHLHSPSSHRIAAQSLLAAARVGKLSKVFYLQP
ncbi:hypothetical protein, conserved [Babesia bigemina]|uniref:C3H1-type domain-containing protein n=1 Tax=Babesia bigemina TaxID=5866 RepID=A0A061BQP9_BABBI|nr:hypothetical protein, conserved [Babesia bigemina]CDR71798.1 hypothetical protein, conserved [Babesia bigemina]|eukprot:XP_012770742.1 hypothetical protein, conserved [Babesia bigemina]